MTDIDPVKFRKLYNEKKLPQGLEMIEFEEEPNFVDMLNIDIANISNKEWKHVIKVKTDDYDLEFIDFITSFGKSFGNVELFN